MNNEKIIAEFKTERNLIHESDALNNLCNKAREEGEKTLLKKASLKLVNDIVYSVPHKAWKVFTKEQRVSFIDLIKRTIISSEEAARQSSLTEIIELKELLDLKDERIEELKAQHAQKDKELDDLKIKITHLESTLQFERAEIKEVEYRFNALNDAMNETVKEMKRKEVEKQEHVRKLKESIENMYHKLGKTNVWRAGNDEVCDICEDYFKREIDEIFPDCTEHTNELNADFRKFAKKTLSGEKDKG